MQKGKHGEASELLGQIIEIHRETQGDQHRQTLVYRHDLAQALQGQKKAAEAGQLLEEGWKLYRSAHQDWNQDVLQYGLTLTRWYTSIGDLCKAEQLIQDGLQDCRSVTGPQADFTVAYFAELGTILSMKDQFSESAAQFREGLLIARANLNDANELILHTAHGLCCALLAQGKVDEATTVFHEQNMLPRHWLLGLMMYAAKFSCILPQLLSFLTTHLSRRRILMLAPGLAFLSEYWRYSTRQT